MSHSTSNHTFVPKPFVNLDIHKSRVSLYPKVTASMQTAERSFAFLVTKAALEAADIPISSKLSLFGQYMDQASLVDILMTRYTKFAEKYIKTAGNFIVTSYHRKTGVVVDNAIDPTTGELFPCEDQNLATR